jgi:hypothetical protein
MKMHASDALHALHSVLAYWVSVTTGVSNSWTAPSHELATVLLDRMDDVVRSDQVAMLCTEITGAVHRARHAIDRPNDTRLYLGPCDNTECRRDIYGAPSSDLARCEGCGSVYDIASRRAWLLDMAQDRLGTAVEVAGLLRAAGINATSAQLRGYAHRGTLGMVTRNAKGHPMYRVRDAVTEVMRAEANRNATPRRRPANR